MRSIVGATLAGLIVLGACGGDDDDKDNADNGNGESSGNASEQEYVDALATNMQDPSGSIPLDEATSTCLATAMVDAIGIRNLQDADVAPDDLANAESLDSLDLDIPEDAADTIAAGVKDCGAAGVLRDGFLVQLASDTPTGLPADAEQCVRGGLTDDDISTAIGNDLANGGTEFSTALLTAVGKCPTAAVALVLSQSPPDIPAEARTCVENYITTNADQVAETFAAGAENGLEGLIGEVRSACPDAQIPE